MSLLKASAVAVMVLGSLMSGRCVHAQAAAPSSSLDLGVSFVAMRSLEAGTGQNFWSSGGSVEIGADAFHGFGLAANVGGISSGSIGSGGIPLAMVMETFGPRYRWHDGRRLSFYGEGLVGEVNGFHSLFPSPSGAQTSATALATQLGGGSDLRIGPHLAVRLISAAWERTQLPNSTNNVQNSLKVGAGLVLRFGTH